MALLQSVSAERDEGQLFAWPDPDPDNGKPVRFRIRRLRDDVDRQIEIKHFGRKPRWKVKNGASFLDIDTELSARVVCEKAAWALLDTENFSGVAGDTETATLWTQLLGIPVTAGQPVVFDGHMSDAFKEKLFSDFGGLANWIVEKARGLNLKAKSEDAEDEEGKG